ncbi:hypothetical protein PF003_g25484 [Phytophthora fragariae]|nr:hypothetical protein PF003_g25484 [Phytophthora fragariae]
MLPIRKLDNHISMKIDRWRVASEAAFVSSGCPARGSGGVGRPRAVLCSARHPAGDCSWPGDP